LSRRDEGSPSFPSDLKISNRAQIIRSFLDGSSLSANDIAASTGLSRQTVMKSILFFVEKGVLATDGKGKSTNLGGKRPKLFSLSRDKYLVSITLWPNDIRLNLFDISGRQIDRISLVSTLPSDPKVAMDKAGQLLENLLSRNKVSKSNCVGVALSTSGIINYKNIHLRYNSQTPQWGTDVPLGDYLAEYLDPETIIFFENAGKMTARPYIMEPSLRDKRVLVVFALWGLSCSLLESGRIIDGKNSLIGEVGHMTIDPADTERCGCGSCGCLERLVSTNRIRRIIDKKAIHYPNSVLAGRKLDQITIPDVFSASAAADPLAREISDYMARIVSIALRNITVVFDPELVIFQGDFAYADDHFNRRLIDYMNEFQYYSTSEPFAVRYDRRDLFEMDASGAFIALQERYFDNPDLYKD